MRDRKVEDAKARQWSFSATLPVWGARIIPVCRCYFGVCNDAQSLTWLNCNAYCDNVMRLHDTYTPRPHHLANPSVSSPDPQAHHIPPPPYSITS